MKVVTGAGKTIVGLAIMERLWREVPGLRVAIVVPTIVLMNQWYEEITTRGTLPAQLVGRAGGRYKDSFKGGARVLIAVLNTASKKMSQDVTGAGVGDELLLIVDECHRAGAAVMSRVFGTRRKYSLGLSATPERVDEPAIEQDDEDESWLEGAGQSAPGYEDSLLGRELGPVVYTLSLAQAIDIGVLPPFEIRHYGLELIPKERAEYDSLSRSITDARTQLEGVLSGSRRPGGSLLAFARGLAKGRGKYSGVASRFVNEASRRKQLLYRATNRRRAVQYILEAEFKANPSARAILFHESIDEVDRLAAELKELLPFPLAVEHSKLPDKVRASNIEAFRDGRLRILVSVKSLIEGFNVPAADVGIIVASSSSARQRVQTLGRILRKHRSEFGEEKHSVMHVLYARDTVDELIYEREDWGKSTGVERNVYFTLDGADVLEPKDRPPRQPLPADTEVDVDSLTAGGTYPGRLEGTEFTTDSQKNVKTVDGKLIDAPEWLWPAVVSSKNQAGKFRVTPRRHFVIVRVREGEDWLTRFVGQLEEPLTVVKAGDEGALAPPAAVGTEYAGPRDDEGGEFTVRQSAAGRHIARKLQGSRGLEFAKPTEPARQILERVEQLRAQGTEVTHFRINSLGHAIAMHGGRWLFVAQPEKPLEF